MNKLLTYIENEDLQALERCVVQKNYSEKDSDEVVKYFAKKYDKDKLHNLIDLIIPIVNNKNIWGSTSFMAWLTNESASHGDVFTLEKILPFVSAKSEKQQIGSALVTSFNYLENAVYSPSNLSVDEKTKQKMCSLLVDKFSDDNSLALLKCIQANLVSCFDVILPKSNIKTENHFVYLYSVAHGKTYFEDKLKPLVDEFDALYGATYKRVEFSSEKEREMFEKARLKIEKSVSNNLNNPVNKLWHLICNKKLSDVKAHLSSNRIDSDILIKMLDFAWDKGKDKYLYVLNKVMPGTLSTLGMQQLMKRDIDMFEQHALGYNLKMKNSMLYSALFYKEERAVEVLLKIGADWKKVAQDLKKSVNQIKFKNSTTKEEMYKSLISCVAKMDKREIEIGVGRAMSKTVRKKI